MSDYDLDKYFKKGEQFTAEDYRIKSKRKEDVSEKFDTWMREGRIKRSDRTTDKINREGPFFEFF